MTTDDMNDYARDPNAHEEDAKGGNASIRNDEIESNGRRFQYTPQDFSSNMRILGVDIQSYGADNERLIKAREEQN